MFPPKSPGQFDVAILCGFIATTQQNHDGFSFTREIHAVALTLEDSQFEYTRTDGLSVAR